jgi:Holin family.
MTEKIKYWFCLFGSVLMRFLGGWDIWITSLITVIMLDIITGIIKALLNCSDKSRNGGLNSSSMFRGGVKK